MTNPKASILLSMLNDLKRNDQVAAYELGVPLETLQSWISGDEEVPASIFDKAAKIWPVNRRDFEGTPDDMPEGILIMTAGESCLTERILDRKNVPYYSYRDTAMSRIAPFKPEWIQELVDVDNNDINDKKICWNNGHLLHQFTYFIGPVNFYYSIDGRKYLAEMSTGDSMYIAPFIPHTFTNRVNTLGQRGLILALTYSGDISGDPRAEMSALGENTVKDMLVPEVFSQAGTRNLLSSQLKNSCINTEQLSERCNISADILSDFLEGSKELTLDDIKKIAYSLNINTKDLLTYDQLDASPVTILRSNQCLEWHHKGYTFKRLAFSRVMPDVKAFEVSLENMVGSEIETSLFQYGYVLGLDQVNITWSYNGKLHQRALSSNDSFVMKPMVKHRFEIKGKAKILLLRAPGKLSGNALLELSSLPSDGVSRAVSENRQWYES